MVANLLLLVPPLAWMAVNIRTMVRGDPSVARGPLTRVLLRRCGVSHLGVLAAVPESSRIRDAALQRLISLSTKRTEQDLRILADADWGSITVLLRRGAAGAVRPGAIRAEIRLLSNSSYAPALEPLDGLADAASLGTRPWIPPTTARIRDEARHAADAIRRRIPRVEESRVLLRASEPADANPDTLLRPASAGEQPPEQLLRRGEDT
jgi:hypothetical protein